MSDKIHPAATHHLPHFVTPPGESDFLFNVVIVLVIIGIFTLGNLYLRLHSLPERLAHGTGRMQFEIIGVMALLALFTHNNLFWVAALLLAFVRFPDYLSPLLSMSDSLEKMSKEQGVGLAAPQTGAAGEPEVPEPSSVPNGETLAAQEEQSADGAGQEKEG